MDLSLSGKLRKQGQDFRSEILSFRSWSESKLWPASSIHKAQASKKPRIDKIIPKCNKMLLSDHQPNQGINWIVKLKRINKIPIMGSNPFRRAKKSDKSSNTRFNLVSIISILFHFSEWSKLSEESPRNFPFNFYFIFTLFDSTHFSDFMK